MARPNILLIIADSAQRGAYGCYGNSQIQTPVIDQLARDGVRFDNHFTTAPICHPSRAAIDTGLHPHLTGQLTNRGGRNNGDFHIWDDLPSYAGVLRTLGYHTGYVGQHHLRPENFDDNIPGYGAFRAAGFHETPRPDRPHNKFFGTLQPEVPMHREDFTRIGALETLERYSQLDSPWLLQVEYDMPHPPFVLAEKWANLYNPADFQAPANFFDTCDGKPPVHALTRSKQQKNTGLEHEWDEMWQALSAHYAGCVSMLDAFTGEIMQKLRDLNLEENTLVIYTSDHGELVGAHGVVTKYHMMYDEVLRVPFVARWPGHLPQGTAVESFTNHTDLWPTLVELAGGEVPSHVQGISWAGLAQGEEIVEERDSTYAQLHGFGANWYSLRMVQNADWKYVWHPCAGHELYDLRSAPSELFNVAESQPEQVEKMQILMRTWMEQVNDPLRI